MRACFLARLRGNRGFGVSEGICSRRQTQSAHRYSSATKVRAKLNSKWLKSENEEEQKIERENEIWRLRASKGESALPPAMHVECRKGKGQHLLKNAHIVDAIVNRAGIRSSDTILEIGPGTGNLTLRLLEVANKVIAVEVDPRMVEELERRVQLTEFAHKLEVVRADVMHLELPAFDICVANIPYKISSPLTFKLLGCASKFRAAVLMLQQEFARRLMATAGNPLFCRLSVNTQLLASVSILMEVGKANFAPPPKVDSTVVCITPHALPPPVKLKEWNNFIRVCFSRKNKTLGAIFRQKHVLSLLAGPFSPALSDPDEVLSEESSDDMDIKVPAGSYLQDEEQEIETGNNQRTSHESLLLLKEKALQTLSAGGFENKRSVKLSQNDFLKLLTSFNEAGVHFG